LSRCFTLNADEERSRHLLLAHALLAQREEGTELVERMKRRPLDVLGERVLLGNPFGAHNAGNRHGAGEPLLLHEEFERAIAPPAGREFELRKLLNRDARLDAADVRLAQHQLVEGDVARLAESDFLL
jgi:hypothetical protein